MIVITDAARLTGAVEGGGGDSCADSGLLAVPAVDPREPDGPDRDRVFDPVCDGLGAGVLLASGTRATAAGMVCGADAPVPPDPLVGGWLPEPGRARVAIIWPSCPPLPGMTCIAPACIMGDSVTQLGVKST